MSWIKKLGITFLTLGFLCILALLLIQNFAPKWITSWSHSYLKKSCPQCTLKIDSLEIQWSPFKITARDIGFKNDPDSNTVVHFTLKRAETRFQLSSLFSIVTFFSAFKKAAESISEVVSPEDFEAAPHLELLKLDQLHVILKEKQGQYSSRSGPEFPGPGAAVQFLPPARVDQILIHDSKLTYENLVHHKIAALHVRDIEGEIGPFVTRPQLLTSPKREAYPLKIRATALLEKSGKVDLHADLEPFAEKNRDHTFLEVRKQNLSELNPFFEVEDGIQLSGTLEKGIAKLTLSQGHLSGNLTLAYSDVGFDYESTPDRGALESFFTTTIQAIVISKTRPKKGEKTPPQAKISKQRQPYEPFTKLFIRGLKDATKEILTH